MYVMLRAWWMKAQVETTRALARLGLLNPEKDMERLDRREFLVRAMQLGAAAAAAPALISLVGCGGGGGKAQTCTDTTGLTPAQIKMRGAQAYTDASPDPAKYCVDCALYTPPAEGVFCGGCTLLAGPIHPQGTCNAFAPKPA